MKRHNSERQPVYEMSEWEGRMRFVDMVGEICAEDGVRLEWLSDYWIGRMERGGKTVYLDGYVLPLNNATANNIMRDKVATSTVLQREGVPVIPHTLIRLPASRETARQAEYTERSVGYPLVIKPNAGESGGTDVVLCGNEGELRTTLDELALRYQTLAVSPYVDIGAEYRVVMLDGEPKIIFEKMRQEASGEWRHNLKLGARPKLQTDPAICEPLADTAFMAMTAVNGRFATVDVAVTATGCQVVEINSGVTLDNFSAYKTEYRQLAKVTYEEAIEKSFQDG